MLIAFIWLIVKKKFSLQKADFFRTFYQVVDLNVNEVYFD